MNYDANALIVINATIVMVVLGTLNITAGVLSVLLGDACWCWLFTGQFVALLVAYCLLIHLTRQKQKQATPTTP